MSARDARALFAAARDDAPDRATRDAVFREVAIATGLATGTAALSAMTSVTSAASAASELAASAGATTSAAGKAGGVLGIKLLAVGAALGTASTALGVILALTVIAPESSHPPARVAAAPAPAMIAGGARLGQPEPRGRDPADGSAKASVAAKAATEARASAAVGGSEAAGGAASDLAEEARLVTAARTALVAGDAPRALALVQGTRKLSARALEPEELGLEARALRAMGRADDAAATELVLRRRYPDHALSR
jgi:hypothetical protein